MVQLKTLGDLRFIRDGTEVSLRSRKEYGLLVYLACHAGKPLQREHLSELLWPSANVRRARHSLSQSVYSIAQYLPTGSISRSRDHISLVAIDLDVTHFEIAHAASSYQLAADLFTGPFLQEFWVPKAPDFEVWQSSVRTDLNSKAIVALRSLLRERELEGDWHDVIRMADRILELDEYDEQGHLGRIRAFAQLRSRSAALEELSALRQMLRDQLNRTDFPELDLLQQEIVGRSNVRPESSRDECIELNLPLVGRSEDFGRLRAVWDSVKASRGQVAIIVGEAGIGKSRLCEHLLNHASLHNVRLFRGRCYASEQHVPYSAVADALRSGLDAEDLADVAPVWVAALGHLLPEILPINWDQETLPSLASEGARRRMFEAVTRVIHSVVTPSGGILFLDDFHWADESTCALVHYLARRSPECPFLLLLALRPEEVAADSTVWTFVANQIEHVKVERVDLAPLKRRSSLRLAALFAEQSGSALPEESCERAAEQSGGRPFFLFELLKSLKGRKLSQASVSASVDLPTSIESYLQRRFRSLSSPAYDVMGALAVAGDSSDLEIIRLIAELDPDDMIKAVEELTRKGVAVEVSGRFRFIHDLVREAAYRSLSGIRRQYLHRATAEILLQRHEARYGVLAAHFDQAGDRAAAFRYATLAAAASEHVYAFSEAEHYLRIALENTVSEGDALDVKGRLGLLLYRTRRFVEAAPLFQELADWAGGANVTRAMDLRVKLLEIKAAIAGRSVDSLYNEMSEFRQDAERVRAFGPVAKALSLQVALAHDTGRGDWLLALIPEMFRLARLAKGERARVDALRVASNCLSSYLDARRGWKVAQHAVALAEHVSDEETLIHALSDLASAEYYYGRLSDSERSFKRALDLADRSGAIGSRPRLLNNLGALWLELGRYSESRELYHQLLELAGQMDIPQELVLARGNMAVIAWELGDVEDLNAQCREIVVAHNQRVVWRIYICSLALLGLSALERGRLAEAQRHGRDIESHLPRIHVWAGDLSSHVEIFRARLASNDGDVKRAKSRLKKVLASYKKRDILCRSRLELEWARLSVADDAAAARRVAQRVRERATRMGARPLVEKAERVLDRIDYGSKSIGPPA